MTNKKIDFVSCLMDYDNGELNDLGTLELFSTLISSGLAWTLQDRYGRTAQALIDDNWIFENGILNKEKIQANCIE